MNSFAVVAVVIFFATGGDAASCLEKLPTMAKYAEAQTECVKSLKLNATQVVPISELKDKHFRDWCVSNCTLESIGFYNNGTLLKDKILETLKKEAAADVYEKMAKVVDTCIERANKKPEMKKKDGKDKKDKKDGKAKKGNRMGTFDAKKMGKFCKCGRAAKFIHCMVTEDTLC